MDIIRDLNSDLTALGAPLICRVGDAAEVLGLVQDGYTAIQVGGSAMATETLSPFLTTRGQPYTRAMSSPVTAYTHCSRLSSYLTLGAISMRTVFQATQARQFAAAQVYGLRKQAAHRAESQAIVKQHGSRKRPRKRPPNSSHLDQLRLPM